ncbi:hypothetical protein EMN47_01860 [Prolixibacteraceae bacterium JC049]|nr:hypothetical protein [Prolixibacteraceae bacterium JC049]
MKTFKTVSSTLLLLMFVVTSTFATKFATELTGTTPTDFGKYSIKEVSEKMMVDGHAIKTFELNYENTTQKFLIGVQKTKKCKNFIVRSESFEVAYLCNKGVFGVKKLNSKQRSMSASVVKKYLDPKQYDMQKIITQKPKTEEQFLGLIACYFPNLIKAEYRPSF